VSPLVETIRAVLGVWLAALGVRADCPPGFGVELLFGVCGRPFGLGLEVAPRGDFRSSVPRFGTRRRRGSTAPGISSEMDFKDEAYESKFRCAEEDNMAAVLRAFSAFSSSSRAASISLLALTSKAFTLTLVWSICFSYCRMRSLTESTLDFNWLASYSPSLMTVRSLASSRLISSSTSCRSCSTPSKRSSSAAIFFWASSSMSLKPCKAAACLNIARLFAWRFLDKVFVNTFTSRWYSSS